MTWRGWASSTASAPSLAWPLSRCWRHSRTRNFLPPAQRKRNQKMNRPDNFLACGICGCVLLTAFSAAATVPSAWQHEQTFNVSTTGLVRINLPVETLDAARPALEDLRLYDDAGNEVPYLIEQPMPAPKIVRSTKSFQVSLSANNTVILLETGLAQPLDA